MTAAVPALGLRQLARPVIAKHTPTSFGHQTFAAEPPGDRTFVTLLSLNFMLLAFFIVLGAAASVDKSRARTVVENVRVVFSGSDEAARPRATLLTARQALQAGVSDAFASLLPTQPRFFVDNSDRVDVDVTESALAASDDIETVYDNIAHVLQMAPAGFRYAILITGGGEDSATGKSAYEFAGKLVDRGVVPQDILIGSSKDHTDHLRLSFVVFEGELDEDGEPWTTGILASARSAAVTPASPVEQSPAEEQPSVEQPSAEQPAAPSIVEPVDPPTGAQAP